MTIDEAIEHERKSAKSNREAEALFMRDDFIWNAKEERKFAEEHEQLAEWLEELKEARKGFEENRKAGYAHGYSDGYAKAIDEFVKEIKELYKDNSVKEDRYHRAIVLPYSKIIEVAEEMRGAE